MFSSETLIRPGKKNFSDLETTVGLKSEKKLKNPYPWPCEPLIIDVLLCPLEFLIYFFYFTFVWKKIFVASLLNALKTFFHLITLELIQVKTYLIYSSGVFQVPVYLNFTWTSEYLNTVQANSPELFIVCSPQTTVNNFRSFDHLETTQRLRGQICFVCTFCKTTK